FAIFASGNTLHVLGRGGYLPLPGMVLQKLPFFSFVRTPSRAIVFVYIFMSIAISQAIVMLWQRGTGAAAHALVAVVAALVVLDFYPASLDMTPIKCSPGLAVLRNDPDPDFGVLDLPRGYYQGNYYMTQQACHGRPIVQGNTSRDMAVTLRDRLTTR